MVLGYSGASSFSAWLQCLAYVLDTSSKGTSEVKRIMLFLGLFVITIAFNVAIVDTSAAQTQYSKRVTSEIMAVIPSDLPPTYFRDKKTAAPTGFAVDIMNEIAKRAGLHVHYIFEDNLGDIMKMAARADADIITYLGIDEERSKSFSFTSPIEVYDISFFVRAKSPIVNAIPETFTVGATKGSVAFDQLKIKSIKHILTYDNLEHALVDLLVGKIDAIAAPVPIVTRLSQESGIEDKIRVISPPIAEVKRAIAVRKDNLQLSQKLNQAIEGFVGQPEYLRIYVKWYGTPTPLWTGNRVIILIGIAVFLMIALIVAWRYYSIKGLNRKLMHSIAERKLAEESLRSSEELYRSLFDHMLNGFAYCRMIFSEDQPRDFIYLAVNDAFTELTGLKDVVGKKVSEVIPAIRESNPELLEIYGRVALSRNPERFETYVTALRMWFSVSVYSPTKEHFVTVFDVITDHKSREQEIERLNKLYATLSGINNAVVRAESRDELFHEICRTTAEHAGFNVVWIGWYDRESHEVKPVGRAGDGQAYLDKIKVYADNRPEGHGPVGTCIRENRACIFNDFQNSVLAAPWRQAAAAYGLRSVAAFPIRCNQEVCGSFVVYDSEVDIFRDKEITLLEEAAIDISFALENLDRATLKREAEVALHQSEERFRRAMDATNDGLWEWNISTGQTYYSPGYFKMLGYEGVEFPDIHTVWTDLIHPDDRAHALSVHDNCIENRCDNFQTEFRMRAKDGSWRWILGRGSAVSRDALGKAILTVGTHVDITDRKRMEEKIIKAKEEWEDTFDAITEILFIHDKDHKIIRANRAYEQIAGMPFSEFIGKPYNSIFPRTDRPDELCSEAVDSGKPAIKEIVIDSTGKTFSLRMYPKLDGEGKYLYSVHVMTDVTVRKQAEAALKASEEMFRQLTENITEVFWVCSPNLDTMIYISTAYEKVWGRTCKSVYETPMSFVDAIHPDDRENALNTIIAGFRKEGFSLEYRIIRPDGSMRWIHARGFQVRDSEGQFYRIAGIAEDITDLKAVQSQILQQEKMASLGQLAAGVAHEINNPIGFITSNMNTLKKYFDKILEFMDIQTKTLEEYTSRSAEADILKQIAERKRSLKIDYITGDIGSLIVESLDGADRVAKIVQDLKNFSRADDAEYKIADINAGIESTINIVWNELKYKATLRKEFGDIPPTRCSMGQLSQVFMNMLVNAAHSIPTQGTITVKTWSANDTIYVSISDTGTGIPADTLDKIFDPFFTTKEVGKGTGLGLSIAYEIIKKHKGEIRVDSEVDKGTTFTISIPIVEK